MRPLLPHPLSAAARCRDRILPLRRGPACPGSGCASRSAAGAPGRGGGPRRWGCADGRGGRWPGCFPPCRGVGRAREGARRRPPVRRRPTPRGATLLLSASRARPSASFRAGHEPAFLQTLAEGAWGARVRPKARTKPGSPSGWVRGPACIKAAITRSDAGRRKRRSGTGVSCPGGAGPSRVRGSTGHLDEWQRAVPVRSKLLSESALAGQHEECARGQNRNW
jgi:hypothetical protein